ncbi:hypothetical protein P9847_09050 [Paenibacillus chibensis]|uniref:Replicative DNA helicase n=1 Tax=Paenibacillus chibensis TaxID=59846 RepID=A0ABU6PTJ4_9BACL|nr:hypothetical protein [Paenibacillus chibensis]
MTPIYDEIFDRYHERKRMLNPCFLFGTGVSVPSEHSKTYKDILLLTLLEIFYRELRDNPHRTDKNLKEIVAEIMERLNMEADAGFQERLASALISSGTGQNREPFLSTYYNETTQTFEEERFLYLTEDTEAMHRLKSEPPIWRVSESGQKIIFMSLEMVDEYSIEFQQLYTLSFIRKGNFQKALSNLDHVKAAVRTRANGERDYAKRIRRDPRWILSKDKEHLERRKELKVQFQDQKKLFADMDIMLHEKLSGTTDLKTIRDIELLKEKVDECVGEHTMLTELVVQNYGQEIALQKQIDRLLNYNRSFVKDIWEKHIYSGGFVFDEGFDALLEPLFSPKPNFIYPLNWVWEEHKIMELEEEEHEEAVEEVFELPNAKRPPIHWSQMVNLWKPVFEAALQHPNKTYRLRDAHLGEWSIDALEMWMKYRDGEFSFSSPLSLEKKYDDQRALLLQHIVKAYPAMIEITQYGVRVESDGGPPIQNDLVTITPFMLTLVNKENGGP